MKELWTDLRLGRRALARRPTFALTALLTLALGIGAATTIFAVVNAVLLRPLSYADPDRLVQVNVLNLKTGRVSSGQSPENFADLRDQSATLVELGGYTPDSAFTLETANGPERLTGSRVSASLLPTLGIRPSAGRAFTVADDDRRVRPSVVVLGEALATRLFGGAVAAVGRTVVLDRQSYSVAGVVPSTFAFPTQDTELWMPMAFVYTDGGRGNFFVRMVGRLKADTTLAQATSALQAIAANLARTYPDSNAGLGIAVTPLHEQITGRARPTVWLLFGAAGLLLLIACSNVANLLLARGSERTREIALRRSLGASRARLVRQFLAESLLLAVGGAAIGLLVAAWGIDLLSLVRPPDIPTIGPVSLDGRVAGFTAIVAIASGLLFGSAPAWLASGTTMVEAVRGAGSRGVSSRSRLRWALVVSEVALSTTLLVGAGLLVRSMWHVLEVDPGFRAAHLVTFDVQLPATGYDRPATARFFADALAHLAATPGVHAAGATTALPLSATNNSRYFTLEGRTGDEPRDYTTTWHRLVSDRYFATLEIPVVGGRDFAPSDFRPDATPVAVVNEAFRRMYFGNIDPVGRRIKMGERRDTPFPWMTVVGVVGDVRHASLESPTQPELYRPFSQTSSGENERRMTLIVSSTEPIGRVVADARQAIGAVDHSVPIAGVATMDDLVASSLARRRFSLGLLEAFALFALILTMVGVYGVVSFMVTHDARAIGIRLALGAQSRDIVVGTLAPGLAWTTLGLVVGLGTALVVSRLMSSVLFGVSPADPISFATVGLIVAAASVGASVVPARRASRIDPVVSLRAE